MPEGRRRTVAKRTGRIPAAKRSASGGKKAMSGETKRKDFDAITKGMRICTNADLMETCAAFTGTVHEANEFVLIIKRDDGMKGKVGPDGMWVVTKMHVAKDAWWHLGEAAACAKCGTKTIQLTGTNIGMVCEECFAKMPTCGKCGEVHDGVATTTPKNLRNRKAVLVKFELDGKQQRWCASCFRKHISMCDDCGKLVMMESLRELGKKRYCEKCIKKYTTKCSECGNEHKKGTSFLLKDGRPMCHGCSRQYRPAIQPLKASRGCQQSVRTSITKAPKKRTSAH